MSASPAADFVEILAGAATLAALGADKVFLNAAAEGTPAPYIVVTATSEPLGTLFGNTDEQHVTLTAAAWGRDADDAEQVGDAIEELIEARPLTDDYQLLSRTGGLDEATTMDVAVLTYDRWL